MFDDLNAYFHENVIDTYTKYTKIKNSFKSGRSEDLRSAINIATVLYHLREQIPKAKRKTRKQLSLICPDYDLLGDIVNASKHKKLTIGNPRLTDANNIYEQIIITLYEDKKGEFSHVEKSVFAKLDDGTERDLFEIITNSLNMWLIELESLGIIKHIKPFSYRKTRKPRRTKNSGRLDISTIQGVRFLKRIKVQKFNYEKGIIEPVDLSKGEVKARVYKPTYPATLELKNKELDKNIKIELELDENQMKHFRKLKEDNEKMNYLISLADKKGLLNQLKKK